MTVSGTNVVQGAFLGTPMIPWREILAPRVEHAADKITWGTTNIGFDNVQSDLVDLQMLFGTSFARIMLVFYGASNGAANPADGDTWQMDLLGYASNGTSPNPPLQVLSMNDNPSVVGNLDVEGVSNGKWVDEINIDIESDFLGEATVYNSETNSNQVALLSLDLTGLKYLFPRLFNVDGLNEATEVPKLGILGRAY